MRSRFHRCHRRESRSGRRLRDPPITGAGREAAGDGMAAAGFGPLAAGGGETCQGLPLHLGGRVSEKFGARTASGNGMQGIEKCTCSPCPATPDKQSSTDGRRQPRAAKSGLEVGSIVWRRPNRENPLPGADRGMPDFKLPEICDVLVPQPMLAMLQPNRITLLSARPSPTQGPKPSQAPTPTRVPTPAPPADRPAAAPAAATPAATAALSMAKIGRGD
jgi:hypothetical protein